MNFGEIYEEEAKLMKTDFDRFLKSVTLWEALSGSTVLAEPLLQSLPTILGCIGVIAWAVIRMKTMLGPIVDTDFRDRSTGL